MVRGWEGLLQLVREELRHLTTIQASDRAWPMPFAAALVQARFFDTPLGRFVGLVGGTCLHSQRFRAGAAKLMRRAIPSRRLP